VGAQADDGVVDVVDGEHDTMQAQRVGRRVLRLGADRRGGLVIRQLQLAMAVGGPHHRDVAPDAVEPDGAVRPNAFDLPLPSSSMPSSVKNATAASRSSTTMATLSIR
jgi:hypothetical protein